MSVEKVLCELEQDGGVVLLSFREPGVDVVAAAPTDPLAPSDGVAAEGGLGHRGAYVSIVQVRRLERKLGGTVVSSHPAVPLAHSAANVGLRWARLPASGRTLHFPGR